MKTAEIADWNGNPVKPDLKMDKDLLGKLPDRIHQGNRIAGPQAYGVNSNRTLLHDQGRSPRQRHEMMERYE